MDERSHLMSIIAQSRAFWEARILLTAAELDVFEPVLKTEKTAEAVAQELNADARGTEMLLDAVASLGLLDKKKGKFRVRPGYEKFLAKSSPETILPLLMHMAHLWDRWGRLTDIVCKGAEDVMGAPGERDEESLNAFIGAMHALGRRMADEVVSRLDLKGRKKLIDVGGGSGVYTIALLKAAPQMRATVFDYPAVIKIAEKKLAEEKLSDRVELVRGNFYKDALPSGHDLALLSAIIHQNSRKQNVDLYRKVYDALVPGGMIVIRDYVMNEEHTQPPDGAFFAINMLVNTEGGGTYSFSEISEDLHNAGFREAKLLHHAEMDSLVTAQKTQ
ncbi:MAG: methyltransferase domain-containing protein [Candidatus Abyssobacteria bacterium SURF_5]|uniref:Methyltransferase domain-containing protein n=1 Tax=Abyssobacteria bacterium (strain SURF_5) TaxID=2093360 RepID=A0A3A4P4Y0_ABYX5|nr:MAG: methyltransferase domain-containing protein [Candidatus Abyssubacteria bacterium SURF_5]